MKTLKKKDLVLTLLEKYRKYSGLEEYWCNSFEKYGDNYARKNAEEYSHKVYALEEILLAYGYDICTLAYVAFSSRPLTDFIN